MGLIMLMVFVSLPILLWAIDKRVVHRPCPTCRTALSRRAKMCPSCRAVL
jgi:hypothetical protein